MAEAEIDNPEKSLVARFVPRRKRWWVTLAVIAFLLGSIVWIWTQRAAIVDDILADQLGEYGVPATYTIESIAPDRQVFTNIVVGDPARPDLTVDRAVVVPRYGFGLPGIARVELVRPRLHATYRGGTLSFGALDPLVFAERAGPPGLPDLDLVLVDARALLETDLGPVGIKAQGSGWLPGGFSGIIAATAPELALDGCRARGATFYGTLATATGQASFDGPIRLERGECADGGLVLARSSARLKATASPDFDRLDATAALTLGQIVAGPVSMARVGGDISATVAGSQTGTGLDAAFDLAASDLRHAQALIGSLTGQGAVRARGGLERLTLDATIAGREITAGRALDSTLAGMEQASENTLLSPLVGRVRTALGRELAASRLDADVRVRRTGDATSLIVPSASLRGASGAALLSLSRFQLTMAGAGLPRFTGNVVTGGDGLPRIAGRMESQPGGSVVFRARMEDYAAGDSRLALPAFYFTQGGDGSLGFAGEVRATGKVPGGSVRNLVVPVSGALAANGRLELWRRCTEVRFDRLTIANLELDGRRLQVCPGRASAIVRSGPSGLLVAAAVPGLDLSGRLAGSKVQVRTGPVALAWPGALVARNVMLQLGEGPDINRLDLGEVRGQISAGLIDGTFERADAGLAAVPLDLTGGSGSWAVRNGVLTLTDGTFALLDRADKARFNPLSITGGALTLQDGVVRATAAVVHPATSRTLADLTIMHDLSRSTGQADLVVGGIAFDGSLQPDMLSELALGFVANVRGTVTGRGRFDWSAGNVTSSGLFESDSLDLAAAFGPVRGVSGTIRFTDLLNLTTAPAQQLRIASVNPGIEAFDGVIEFALKGGETLAVSTGTWPFLGGQLTLEPVTLNFGEGEVRRYVFRVEGLEAARFVQQMELGNINATGVFDGVLPIVFDEMGNGRIEGGALDSRRPGGNISYIGELTYQDMGAIANFAFAALRSLDYKTMEVRMDGPLTGEIVTRVRFDGVSQGEGTRQNFITRQIAGLPIRFNVNIRAPFYQLITSIRAMYDPAFIRDPRSVGLLTSDGERLTPRPPLDAIKPEDPAPDELPIQTQESETMP
ncbi:MAG: YdbH domain-containing protein [Sphingomonadaceae bacterium]